MNISEELALFSSQSILPQIISETGDSKEPILDVIICSGIAGGAQYKKNMPRFLTLTRKQANGQTTTMNYQQVDVMEPCPECHTLIGNIRKT